MSSVGVGMHALIEELFPICRSLTGDGVRATLRRVQREIPLVIHDVPSGTPVLDWTVPDEWNVRDAYVANEHGERVVDFRRSNLHLVGYSVPVRRRMTLAELRPHLHSLPEHPDWVPYRTSYFRRDWGFCLTQRTLEALPHGPYDVCIDGTLEPGYFTYGECVIPGETEEEVLLSAHVCHPSLANDNLSGVAVAVELAKRLLAGRRRYGYRIVFAPATLGAIVWLARNRDVVPRIRHGLVLSCVGDRGALTYKRSRRGHAPIDLAMEHVLRRSGDAHRLLDFEPWGYDERQYCSPGFDLPVGRLTRSPNGGFPEYHSSADDLQLVRPEALADTLETCWELFRLLERERSYRNLSPFGEPQLGRRGLYEGLAGRAQLPDYELALLWVLNLSDGAHSLREIADRSGLSFDALDQAAGRLVDAGLLRDTAADDGSGTAHSRPQRRSLLQPFLEPHR